jgi:hypothetical protein
MYFTFTREAVVLHILFVVLAFHFWWPLGLAALAFVILRRRAWRRMAYSGGPEMFGWANANGDRMERRVARAQEKVGRAMARAEGYCGGAMNRTSASGNHAFDEYRGATLKRLEDEQREFHGFLGQLRAAKDRAEFDAFMADRRRRDAEPPAPPAPPQG